MDKRKAGILLACLLGSVLLLYLGGLLGQLLYNYEEWMRQDGITGGLLMAELKASPLYSYPLRIHRERPKGYALSFAWHWRRCAVCQATR